MATNTEKSVATATSITTTTPTPVASAANSSAEPNPKKTVAPASHSTDKSDHPATGTLSVSEISVKESEGSKTSETNVGSVAGDSGGPVNDIQKKIRRAERFGVPVQLSEQEKRNTRAERFGTAPSSNGSEASKQSEELKRKARAERFGLAVPSTATDEEAKKKARLARFAPFSKSDTVEEEKRKARAIRFSNPPSNSLSKVNGKGNIEPEAPIAGKAGGGL
ncbi:protein MODIFIER OF SNC1 11-like [Durio zibethinus]|uniref:Protein MODIFIER OF SNC1 11-like n=1 Tax=Durio zibethinus TaxID=66656 RepID=A0A6P6ARC1_DURZI|nr:protein MODIFIER OF SNC1 11-like [Durio zibethinus]